MSISVACSGLSKSFGKVQAVKNVSFNTNVGEIFGIIGADGAGKTSLLRMLTTLLLPDNGSASINGLDLVKDFKSIRNIIGYMPGVFSLYTDLSVEENLEFFAAAYGTTVKENFRFIKDIYSQLEPFKKRKTMALSGGMKQKLALCCALIHKPEVLFLDEPTTGVDAVSRREFWEILKRLKNEGISVLVSTPYMDEASLCGRIALMHDGAFLTVDSPDNIVKSFGRPLFALQGEVSGDMLNRIRSFSGTRSCYAFGDSYHITLHNGVDIAELVSFLALKGVLDPSIPHITPGVEDCFMEFLQ